MTNRCTRSLKVCADRITKIAQDGSPVVGSLNTYTASDLVTLTVTTEYSDDDDFEVRGASGANCLSYFAFGALKRLGFEMDRCAADPEFGALLIGESTITSGDAVGFRWPAVGSGNACGGSSYYGVGYEAWTLNVGADGTADALPYLRWLFPRTLWRVGEKNFENAPMSHKFSGVGFQNSQWLDGPANDWPVGSDRVGQWLPVSTVPTAACGASAVSTT